MPCDSTSVSTLNNQQYQIQQSWKTTKASLEQTELIRKKKNNGEYSCILRGIPQLQKLYKSNLTKVICTKAVWTKRSLDKSCDVFTLKSIESQEKNGLYKRRKRHGRHHEWNFGRGKCGCGRRKCSVTK